MSCKWLRQFSSKHGESGENDGGDDDDDGGYDEHDCQYDVGDDVGHDDLPRNNAPTRMASKHGWKAVLGVDSHKLLILEHVVMLEAAGRRPKVATRERTPRTNSCRAGPSWIIDASEMRAQAPTPN